MSSTTAPPSSSIHRSQDLVQTGATSRACLPAACSPPPLQERSLPPWPYRLRSLPGPRILWGAVHSPSLNEPQKSRRMFGAKLPITKLVGGWFRPLLGRHPKLRELNLGLRRMQISCSPISSDSAGCQLQVFKLCFALGPRLGRLAQVLE